ncbi:MAG: bifunctional 5,10-methylenetetrahydrofolate dehydrogenase/5,10-methenyltetrahydrofolate cyclohydrolase [Patescibacteria group bacterium]
MQIIDGKKIAQEIIDKLKSLPILQKIFAAILVGDNPQSESFLKQKEKVAKELGIDFRLYNFPENSTNDFLRKEVGKIALLKRVGGVIVQLPLPEQINKHYVLNVIPREKDVDVLGERALGAFYTGRNLILPPAVGVVEEILKFKNLKILDLKVAVVGAGFLVGKPIAIWLIDKVKELTIFEKGSDLSKLKNYDLIISGVGQADLIKLEMLKDGVGIIDFGYSMNENGKLGGDFDISEIENCKLKIENFWYTPTPGGTGPVLVAKVFENFYKLNSDKL